jgi:hypothetical protein
MCGNRWERIVFRLSSNEVDSPGSHMAEYMRFLFLQICAKNGSTSKIQNLASNEKDLDFFSKVLKKSYLHSELLNCNPTEITGFIIFQKY